MCVCVCVGVGVYGCVCVGVCVGVCVCWCVCVGVCVCVSHISNTQGVNFKVNTSFGGSRYQGLLRPKVAGEFSEYRLGFRDLVLMFKGKLAKNQSKLDVGHIERIYFVMGGRYALPGKFELEIDRIQWIKFGEEDKSASHTLSRYLQSKGVLPDERPF
jgi:hypothetical protein